MRLFIACKLFYNSKNDEDNLKKSISSIQDKIKKSNFARVTNVNLDNMHLTLKFLGGVSIGKSQEIKEKLGRIVFNPFKVKLNYMGVFPNENNIRVIWAGMEPEEGIIQLQHQIENALFGLSAKDEEFSPHLTLCRVKSVKNKKGIKDLLKTIKIEPVEFEVIGFELIKSELTPKGPKYKTLKEFSFQKV